MLYLPETKPAQISENGLYPTTKTLPYWKEGMFYPTGVSTITDFTGQSLYSAVQFDSKALETVAQKVEEVNYAFEHDTPRQLAQRRTGVGLFSAFYDKSTRSRLSFEIGVNRIGGWVVGESIETAKDPDTRHAIRVVSGTGNKGVDIVTFRHPRAGSVFDLIPYATKPFINAGDGNREHIFQGLKDYTFWAMLFSDGRTTDPYYLNGKEFTSYGDNLNSRTNHSTLYFIALHGPNVKINLVSPPLIQAPDKLVQELSKFGAKVETYDSLEDLDRRNGGPGDHIRVVRPQDNLIKDKEMKRLLLEDPAYKYLPITKEWLNKHPFVTVDHPMPIYDEIPNDLDFHPQVKHMQLAEHGYPTATALIELLVPPFA